MSARSKLALGSVLMLVAAVLPLASVAAHACFSVVERYPSDPNNPDSGCSGADCPCKRRPHEHANLVPPQNCQKSLGPGCGCGPEEEAADVICVDCPPELADVCAITLGPAPAAAAFPRSALP